MIVLRSTKILRLFSLFLPFNQFCGLAIFRTAKSVLRKHVDIGAFKERLEVSSGLSLVDRLQRGRDRVRMKRVEDADRAGH